MNKCYEKIICPICKSKKFEILRENLKPNITIAELKKFYSSSSDKKLIDQLSKCKNCDFILLNPRVKKKNCIRLIY